MENDPKTSRGQSKVKMRKEGQMIFFPSKVESSIIVARVKTLLTMDR
jgi:hypothetical protein